MYVKKILVVTEDFDGPLKKTKKGDKDYKTLSLVCAKKTGSWKITSMYVSLIEQTISHQLQNN